MRKRLGLAILGTVIVASPSFAESRSAEMTVSVQVVARAVVTSEQVPSVVITEADVARGFVDVAQPMQVHVKSNSPRGYLLQVAKTDESFAAVELSFDNARMNVAQESWIARPYVRGGETVNAKIRVRLAEGAMPGTHPLPVQVSASPL
ncbi:MAG TPA: hypothetical protein VF057_10660 [Thermoanaerobaculia bacterium]